MSGLVGRFVDSLARVGSMGFGDSGCSACSTKDDLVARFVSGRLQRPRFFVQPLCDRGNRVVNPSGPTFKAKIFHRFLDDVVIEPCRADRGLRRTSGDGALDVLGSAEQFVGERWGDDGGEWSQRHRDYVAAQRCLTSGRPIAAPRVSTLGPLISTC